MNPKILRWARESANLDVAQAAKKIGLKDSRGSRAEDRLIAMENGEVSPSRPQLAKLAKTYRRPLLTFYLSQPPRKGNRGQDFRILPEGEPEDQPLLDALIRDIQARQGLVRALLEDEEETSPLTYIGSFGPTAGKWALVESIMETLDFDVAAFRAARNPDGAFKLLRSRAEAIGVFVLLIGDLGSHHSALSVESFRGFAIADEIAPFIVINDKDSRAAWSFTLLHELVHLWLGQTGISGRRPDRQIEKLCNDVASEILLPGHELVEKFTGSGGDSAELEASVKSFAQARNVSSSMVAYKLARQGLIDHATWRALSSRFQKYWAEQETQKKERNREQSGAPSYYVVRRHRIGNGLLEFVHRMLAAGELTTAKAGRILGVKATQVEHLVTAATT